MSEKKILVPAGMIEVACRAYPNRDFDPEGYFTRPVLEAALRWQDAELEKMYDKVNQPFGCDSEAESNRLSNVRHGRLYAIEDVRRMFLAPEPEVLKDGTVEYLNGTTRPVAIWWEGSRWPITTLSAHKGGR